MDIIKSFRKCVFCREKGKNLLYVRQVGCYGETGANYAYHGKCLNMVACEPENYRSRQIDMAIDIVDLIKYWKREDTKRAKRAQERCDYIKQTCV